MQTEVVEAPPARVYQAIKQVRADEIALFRTLTWIRRGGRELPEGILNPGNRASLIDVATRRAPPGSIIVISAAAARRVPFA